MENQIDLNVTDPDQLTLLNLKKYNQLPQAKRLEMLAKDAEYLRMKKMPSDPLHPFYYHVYAHTLPPEQAYRIVDVSKFSFPF